MLGVASVINIYSDPHIGLNLASNTTAKSRKALKKYIIDHVNQIINEFDEGLTICAGDFYHTYQNPEEVLHESLWAASQTSKILAGNHDVVNIADRKGTLDIVGTVLDPRVVPCKFGKINYQPVVASIPHDQIAYLVPHHSSQNLFEDALAAVRKSAEKESKSVFKLLVLHCNYNSKFVKDTITLNLPERLAIWLLKVFDYIVIGHEHNYRLELNDRVIVAGSPHPTGFGDISDKFTIHFDDDNTLLINWVWKKDTHYLQCDWHEAVEKIAIEHQWVSLTGEVAPSELHELASVIKKVWANGSPFAVRSEVKILTGGADRSAYQSMSPDKINEIIETELRNSPELYNLWKEIIDDQGTAS